QAPDADCALPSEPKGIPAAIDAAITGAADKDRACMKALLMPEARMVIVSLGADGAPSYTFLTLDDWIARTRARGHAVLEEKQLQFHVERYGNIAPYGAATRCTATASKSRAASTAFKRSKKPAAGELRASWGRRRGPLRRCPRHNGHKGGSPREESDSLRGRAFRRFAGNPLPLLVTGFL